MNLVDVQYPVFTPYNTATVEIYVAGCWRNCPNCHGKDLKDFNSGVPLDIDALVSGLIERKALFNAISIVGGDLLCQNEDDAFKLASKLKSAFPDKQFWLFTGENTFGNMPTWAFAIFDVIKYGSYVEELKQEGFPASSNQTVWYKQNS